MNDSRNETVEGELAARTSAPRVTLKDLDDNIAHTAFFNMGQSYEALGVNPKDIPDSLYLLTICVLTLKNGFTVTGESACASKENYLEDIGQRIARTNAENKIWPLMGYELRTQLMGK